MSETDIPTDFRYGAFISYRHIEPDRSWAQWLHGTLESFRTPKSLQARGIPARVGRVFRDEEELPASADLSLEVDKALQQSKFLIVVCSPNTPKSRWVEQEIVRFQAMGRGDNIIALLVDGEPQTSFPSVMCNVPRQVVNSDGTTHEVVDAIEPLAADVRDSRLEPKSALKRMARMRILAGVLGCRFDDLRQRAAQRRRRQLVAASVAAVALIAVLGASLLFALRQRDDAIKQKTIAVVERQRADDQRTVAEEQRARALDALEESKTLLTYVTEGLLGSLDPRTSRGRVVSVSELLDKASEELGTRFTDRPRIEASVRFMLGRVYLGVARFQEARSELEQALALFRRVDGKPTLAQADTLELLGATASNGDWATFKAAIKYTKMCADIRAELLGPTHELTLRSRMDHEMYVAMQAGDLPPGVASEPVLKVFAVVRGRDESIEQVRAEVIRLVHEAEQMWKADDKEGLKARAEQEAAVFMKNPIFAQRVPTTWSTFALSLQAANRPDAARALVFCAYELSMKHYGETHSSTMYTINATAKILYAQEKPEEALPWHKKLLTLHRKVLGSDNQVTLNTQSFYAAALFARERYQEAEATALDLAKRRDAASLWTDEIRRSHATFMVRLYQAMKRPDDAATWQAKLDKLK